MSQILMPEGLRRYTTKLKAWVTEQLGEATQIATIMRTGTGGLVSAPVIFENPFGNETKRVLIRSVTSPMDSVEAVFTEDSKTAKFVGSRMEVSGEALQTWLIYGEAKIDKVSLTLTAKTGVITPEFEFPFMNDSIDGAEIIFGNSYPFCNIQGVPYVATFFK